MAFWAKTKGRETWKIFTSTDTDINFISAIKYYQSLSINKCQSSDYGVRMVWITKSYINDMMIILVKRFQDYESIGEVSRVFKMKY